MKTHLLCLSLGLVSLLSVTTASYAASETLYLGTYTGPKSQGIYRTHLDLATGELSKPELVAESKNPSFLVIAPNHHFMYAVNEIDSFNGQKAGAVSAFSIDAATGKLTLLNQQSAGGPGPCHVNIDRTGKVVTVANYGGGSIASLPVLADGKLAPAATFVQHTGSSVNPNRQKEPHAHSVNFSPDNRFAFAADLGLDKVLIYKMDTAKGTLTPSDPAFARVEPGFGPRHFAFHPSGRFAYVISEMMGKITAFNYDAKTAMLTEFQTLASLPKDQEFKPSFSGAEVQVHPSGKFLYASLRGCNLIAVFALNPMDGKLTLVENVSSLGKTPRNFGIDPTGQYLLAAHQDSDNVVVFHIDKTTGKLTPAGHSIELGSPVCVKFYTP